MLVFLTSYIRHHPRPAKNLGQTIRFNGFKTPNMPPLPLKRPQNKSCPGLENSDLLFNIKPSLLIM
jgi:hypothetical protein